MLSKLCSPHARLARLAGGLMAAFLLVVPNVGAQQAGSVTGRVLEQQTGRPIASVQVFISELNLGGLTQQDGRYLILNVPVGTHILTAARIGYRAQTQTVTVAVGEPIVLDYLLTEDALRLDEIIVTGTPGGTQRRAIGNSVVTVDVLDLVQAGAVSDMQSLLTARTPGLSFTRISTSVGAGAPLQIRGSGSFSLSSDPLIYVDGIRVNNDSQAGPNANDGRQINVLDDFNPEDIESIEIIKGPAAATLYGTEASAGVIQIITKKGQEGPAQISLTVRQGVNYIKDPTGRLGTQWGCTTQFAPPCRDGSGLFSYNMHEEANLLIQDGAFPWPTDNLYQNGSSRSYNLDVSGGTPNLRYFISGNYDTEEGALWYNTDETYRMRANLGIVFSEYVSFDLSTSYVDGFTRLGEAVPGDGGEWTDMGWSNGFCLPRVSGTCDRKMGFQEHLPSDVAKVESTRDYSRFTGSGTLSFFYGGWLSSRAVLGVDKGWDENTILFPLESLVEPVYEEASVGKITLERPITTHVSVDWSATADFDLDDTWGTATSVGVQYNEKNLSDFGNIGEGFVSDLSRTINQTPPSKAALNFSLIQNKSIGFFVQEQVSFNERIFVTAAIRFDDNSAFGSDFDLEKYPKVSATWVISEESFWNVDQVNSLRLRAAWGKAGRQPDTFAGTNLYSVIPGPGGAGILNPTSPGNPEVGPETSSELELGFDVAMLDDRLAGEFTYYKQKNENALLSVGLPPSLGFAGATQRNLGRIDNWGWEATLNARLYQSQAVSFDLRLTANHMDNEIKELGDFQGASSTHQIRIGLPYPNTWTRFWVVSAEFDPSALGTITNAYGDKVAAMCDSGVNVGGDATGRSQYGVLPGGPIVDCSTLSRRDILIGRRNPSYTFTVNPNISLFGNSIRISVVAEGEHGKYEKEQVVEWAHLYNNSRHSRAQDDPLWVAGDRLRDERMLETFDGDFWKLREVSVRYQLPESLLMGVDRASLSLAGRNLANLWRAQTDVWGVQVADPEHGSAGQVAGGANWFNGPPLTTWTATMRVTF